MFRTDRIGDNLVTLKKIGVTREKANNLARLDWVTREYIEAHYRQAVEVEHQSVGLAIWRIEHGKGIGRIMLIVALVMVSLACVTSAVFVPAPTVQGTPNNGAVREE